jgi:hypothetical protein
MTAEGGMTGRRAGYRVACGLLAATLGWSAAGHLARLELPPDVAIGLGVLEVLAAVVLVSRVLAHRLRRRRGRGRIVLLSAEVASPCEPPREQARGRRALERAPGQSP